MMMMMMMEIYRDKGGMMSCLDEPLGYMVNFAHPHSETNEHMWNFTDEFLGSTTI